MGRTQVVGDYVHEPRCLLLGIEDEFSSFFFLFFLFLFLFSFHPFF